MRMRLLLGGLAFGLLAVIVATFYNFGSIPTDENIFVSIPSGLYVPRPHTEMEVSWKSGRKDPARAKTWEDFLRGGDFIVAVDSQKVYNLQDFQRLLQPISPHSTVRLDLIRPGEDASGELRVRRGALPDSLITELAGGAAVTQVTEGGASDRAGMHVGDVIVRINGQAFKDAQEADRILRRAQSGRAYTYEVLRGASQLTLWVTLAQFGFPLAPVVLSLSGVIFLGFGSFIALGKPNLKPARILGLSFILLGFFVAIAGVRREPDVTLFVGFRAVLLFLSMYLGFATAWHAHLYFPRERPEILAHPWLIRGMYAVAVLFAVVLLYLGTAYKLLDGQLGLVFFLSGFLVLGLCSVAVKIAFRKQRSKLYAQQARLINITGLTVAAVTIAFTVYLILTGHSDLFGFVGVALVLIPLAHLYTIGRYRLLDMNLRIRRNIRYTLVTIGWTLLCVAVVVLVFDILVTAHIRVMNVAIHGTSIEVSDAPAPGGEGGSAERLVFMLLALVAWYAVWKVRRIGQGLIDRRYYRGRYDYRKALNELSGMLASKLGMTDLGRGIVEKLVELMRLKRAGVYFFRDQSVCCCQEAFGIDAAAWKSFCAGDDPGFIAAIKPFSGAFSVDYLPDGLKERLRGQEFRHIVPIRSKDRLIGALLLGEKLSESPFGQEDQDFLSAAAMQASVSIENAFLYEELAGQERMKQELEIARRIQLASLPQRVPAISGLDIAGRSIPALEVGGDFYDYLNGMGESVTVVVGDVSGKGTSAALYMSKVQGILRSLHDFTPSPGSLLVHANRLLSRDMERSSFVTVAGAAVDPASRTAVLARAGHLPVYLYRGDSREVERLVPRGVGLGLGEDVLFASELEERTIAYKAGDILLFVTDGITEARNTGGEEFGEERLQRLLQGHAALKAEALRDCILGDVKAFAGASAQHDDQTVVVVKAV